MHTITSKLTSMDLANQRVFYRVDINVPISRGTIIQDFRLQKIRPTLDYLLTQNAQVLIAGHLGRPKGFSNNLSFKNFISWFSEQGYPVTFAATIAEAQALLDQGERCVLLENLRFTEGEKSGSLEFAEKLKTLAPLYVTDAWGTMHRADSSVAQLPLLYADDKRTIGFLVEQELTGLNRLLDKPNKPFLAVLGGGKVRDKLPLITTLAHTLDQLLLCPATIFTFLRALDIPTGASLVDVDSIPAIKKLIVQIIESKPELVEPTDYVVREQGYLDIKTIDQFTESTVGLSIGPKTVEAWQPLIADAGSIFVNGLPGMINEADTYRYYADLLRDIGNAAGYSVIGGGDAVAAALISGAGDNIDFLSTGGGATLAYLSNAPMPGLEPFD